MWASGACPQMAMRLEVDEAVAATVDAPSTMYSNGFCSCFCLLAQGLQVSYLCVLFKAYSLHLPVATYQRAMPALALLTFYSALSTFVPCPPSHIPLQYTDYSPRSPLYNVT